MIVMKCLDFVCQWSSTYYAASIEVKFVVASIHKFAMIEMKRLDMYTTPSVWVGFVVTSIHNNNCNEGARFCLSVVVNLLRRQYGSWMCSD